MERGPVQRDPVELVRAAKAIDGFPSGSVLVRGGRVVDPTQSQLAPLQAQAAAQAQASEGAATLDAVCDVLIVDGVVEAVGTDLEAPEGAEILDATGKVVIPGLIDIHVHLREPGQEWKETVASGTRAAAAGGFTAVACMANTQPTNDCRSVTEHIVEEARRAACARVYPLGAISKGLAGRELAEFGDMAKAGAVAVSDDGKPVENAELMRRAFDYARHFDLPVVQHAQDMEVSGDGVMHEGEFSARLGVPSIPAIAEDLMVARDLLLLEETGGRYHVQHLSSGRSVELIKQAKERGLAVSCEVSPHHLLLTDEDVWKAGLDPNIKMNPPLRSAADRDALVAGLLDGTIDCIASDHAPHHPDEKQLDFSAAPFGIVGLETMVSLILDRFVRSGHIDLARFVELLSTVPAQLMGLPGGSLAPGSIGDVTLLDLECKITVDAGSFESLSRNTPFDGWTLAGAPAGTVVSGRII